MRFSSSARISLLALGLVAIFFLGLLVLQPPPNASPKKIFQGSEKKREIQFQHNVPPEIKFLGIRNLQNEDWENDLEVEIQNISDKHIYYVLIVLILPEVSINGYPSSFRMEFGDPELIQKNKLARANSNSIRPGDKYIFSIPKKQVKNVKEKKAELGIMTKVTKILFNLNVINFGDGTGYFGGKADFRKIEGQSSISPRAIGSKLELPSPSLQRAQWLQPATYLRTSLSPEKKA